MDPLSVLASVTGLLMAGAQISSTLQRYISGSINAPSFAQTTHLEIHDFVTILSQLQPFVLGSAFADHSRASMIDVHQIQITLTGCVCTFSELEEEVNGLGSESDMSITDRVKWVRAEQTISRLVQRLQNHKASLTLMLTILTCGSSSEAVGCMNKLCTAIGQLVESNTELSERVKALESKLTAPATDRMDDSISIASSRTWRPSFESALFKTRLYKRISGNGSVMSLADSRPCTARWSVVSGISLGEISNISVLSLPISAAELYNPSWYEPEVSDITSSRVTKSSKKSSQGALMVSKKQKNVDLLQSAREGDDERVKMLLEIGANIESEDVDGKTALHLATSGGHQGTAGVLLGWGANKQARDQLDHTPLHLAANCGQHEMVSMLLVHELDKEAKDKSGKTPLHSAARIGYHDIVQILLDNGADVQARDRLQHTALHLAARRGHLKTVRILLDFESDMEAKDELGHTPLHAAARSGYHTIAQLLLESGAEKEAKDWLEHTPLHLAAAGGHCTTAKLLLDCGVDKEARDWTLCTPLHSSAQYGHQKMTQMLLNCGSNKEAKDCLEHTPLELAIHHRHHETVGILRG